MGLKNISEQFRDDLLRVNLQTPPDVVVGLTDLGGSLSYSAYKDSQGADAIIHTSSVNDAGNVLDLAIEFRKYLFKRNLQTPSDIEAAIIDLSANQSETMRNMGSIGTDTNINWRSVVVDAGTVENAGLVNRMANLSRNKPRDTTDPSESNLDVVGDGYNYTSLLQTIGEPAKVNNFIVPNVLSISSPDNAANKAARALDLKINRYTPEQYDTAIIRENILNEVYKRTTYVADYTTSLKNRAGTDYDYFGFYDLNSKATIDSLLANENKLLKDDTMLMNIGAYMLNYNLNARLEQNLYTETLGKVQLIKKDYNSDSAASLDALGLIRAAKDPLDNIVEKNFTITMPRNFVNKTAQFLLGLEGIVSPFDLWESVDVGREDSIPQFLASNKGIDALRELDENGEISVLTDKKNTARENRKIRKIDESLLKKTGSGQRWALYENLMKNKYSPSYDTTASIWRLKKHPKGNYYLGSELSQPIEILQVRDGISIVSNEAMALEFNKGFADAGGYNRDDIDVIWSNNANDGDGQVRGGALRPYIFSADVSSFRPDSLMDITQKLVEIGGIYSPIRSLKTKFRDGKMVYSKGNAVKRITTIKTTKGNKYEIDDVRADGAFCRTWTKLKPYHKIKNLVRYGELIRRERNSVIDQNANYNIFPSKLNVGTLYDQGMLSQDGIKERFADKNFDKVRARKYMFSIENLAWKDSPEYNDLPAYEQGSNGGRVMWFPPYGLTFNESSTANWTKHDFLGRPEPIYTYNNTERTGTLSWMVIVDHPTILNVLVQKELSSMSDAQVQDILDAFFAGCVEYDIFELARIWGMFSNSDIAFFKDVINGQYAYPLDITEKKRIAYNYKTTQNKTVQTSDIGGAKVREDLSKLQFFFPNDLPKGEVIDYDTIFQEYLGWLTDGKQDNKYDYSRSIGHKNEEFAKYFVTEAVGEGKETVSLFSKYKEIEKSVALIQDYLTNNPENVITIGFDAFTSSVADEAYNKQLAKRRAESVVEFYRKRLGLDDIIEKSGDDLDYQMILKRGAGQSPAIIFKVNFKDTNEADEADPQQKRRISSLGRKDVKAMFEDVGWTMGTNKIIATLDDGTVITDDTYVEEQFKIGDAANAPDGIMEGSPLPNRYYSVLSYPASYARRVQLNVVTDIQAKETVTETTFVDAVESDDPQEGTISVTTETNMINKRDIATRILNKLIGENEYFEFLREDSPVIFDSLKEKLRYFTPAFHSMTPEGLNSRLTFLNQCVRPGSTVKTVGGDSNDVVNTAFGKPPVCILRLGDFYNTRMIIDNFTIDYDVVGGVNFRLKSRGYWHAADVGKSNRNRQIYWWFWFT